MSIQFFYIRTELKNTGRGVKIYILTYKSYYIILFKMAYLVSLKLKAIGSALNEIQTESLKTYGGNLLGFFLRSDAVS